MQYKNNQAVTNCFIGFERVHVKNHDIAQGRTMGARSDFDNQSRSSRVENRRLATADFPRKSPAGTGQKAE
jgi:hypothetical protein